MDVNNSKTISDDKVGSLSIIVPAYNEEDGIQSFLEELQKEIKRNQNADVDLIVVDDGSTDKTAEIIGKIPDIAVLYHKHNYGYGAALKTGINAARFDNIAIIDADNSYYCEDIFRLFPFIDQNDMVVGQRTGDIHERMKLRRFAKWFLIKLAEYLTKSRIPDINSGLRIIDKAALEKFSYLLPDTFSFTTTITLAILTNMGNVHFESIKVKERTGRSKIKPIKDSMRFFYQILTTILCFKPVRIFMPITFCFLFLGIFFGLFSFYFLEKFMDTTTILCFITSLQFLGISLVAELIVRISKKG
jgi:glycosyltransferase involved in cell wall biosynthesis